MWDFPPFWYTMDQAHQAIPSMEKEQCMIITYHEIRNISKEKLAS